MIAFHLTKHFVDLNEFQQSFHQQPAETPDLAIGVTKSHIPVPWLGSTIIGK